MEVFYLHVFLEVWARKENESKGLSQILVRVNKRPFYLEFLWSSDMT